jgi:hypothetical protein
LNLLGQVAPSVTTSPGSGAAPGNTALATQESHEYDGRFQIAEAFRNGSVLSFEYDYRTTLQAGNPAPFLWRLGNAKYTRKMSRYAAVRLGYGYGQARDGLTAGGAAVINQNLDVGLDYARPLSSSRRTRFSTATGSAIVTDRGVRYYRLMIDSTLTREIGRSWNANINYHRGVQYVEGVAGPIYADTVQARFGGLVTRRLSVKTSAGYSNGDIGLTATRSGYTTYSGTADMRFAISRELSIDVQYVNYHYDFGQGAPVLSGIPSTLSRQGLRVGLAGWLPITR